MFNVWPFHLPWKETLPIIMAVTEKSGAKREMTESYDVKKWKKRERKGGKTEIEAEVWIDILCWQLTSPHAESSLNDPSIEYVN